MFTLYIPIYSSFIVCDIYIKYVNLQPCRIGWVSLTLRGLSLFLLISNTGVSAAYILVTVHFLYSKLGSLSDMEYYFYQLAYWASKVPKRFIGLFQMQCSPSWLQHGQTKQPHYMLAPATLTILGFTAREMSRLPTRLRGQRHQSHKLRGRWGAAPPSNPH